MITIYDAINKASELEKKGIVDFLHIALGQYGDPKPDIKRAIDYSQKEFGAFGGFTLVLEEDGITKGAVVVNNTGMSGYIPENILVYIAVSDQCRGQGIGKRLMTKAISLAKGDIALHVEKDNPAKFLYEKLGFTNPYLEMRLKRK